MGHYPTSVKKVGAYVNTFELSVCPTEGTPQKWGCDLPYNRGILPVETFKYYFGQSVGVMFAVLLYVGDPVSHLDSPSLVSGDNVMISRCIAAVKAGANKG
ncbi:hypothetical protein AVEN_263289-1 [Araneus ventricosus]|uniref:Uncharacterized protein n=1 Tax=Araneus ventricosus TaxID=182803 RepID=A0A4Y2L951_ARAVE|nr:hypothetical protein AVEN_263289-1 [Araneus ventricosus]